MRKPPTSRFHQVVNTVHTNRAITAGQARYAVWNAIDLLVIHGCGVDTNEPWETGKIRVPRNPLRRRTR